VLHRCSFPFSPLLSGSSCIADRKWRSHNSAAAPDADGCGSADYKKYEQEDYADRERCDAIASVWIYQAPLSSLRVNRLPEKSLVIFLDSSGLVTCAQETQMFRIEHSAV
jgi:hypothetical protein